MSKPNISILTTLFALLLITTACNNSTSPEDEVNFDRPQMLSNYGDNIILPAFENLQEAANFLHTAAEDFEADPTTETLTDLQSALKDSRLAWQDAAPFQFGPAESALLRASLNTYPTDPEKINEYHSSGNYSLGSIDSRDAAGFPALGYLLHGTGEDEEEVLAMYTADEEAENRLTYLLDNTAFIQEQVDAVTTEWQADGGDYIGMFLSEDNAGTDVGSSLGMLVNSLVMHYERFLRDGKIGIPAGIRSAGVPRPTSTEAYYGGYSAELAIANLKQIEVLFHGGPGEGLDDNLSALGAEDLAQTIDAEIEQALTALEQLSDPLSVQIEENNDPMLATFEEMQDAVTLLKADMTSVLGITITYQDNDGD